MTDHSKQANIRLPWSVLIKLETLSEQTRVPKTEYVKAGLAMVLQLLEDGHKLWDDEGEVVVVTPVGGLVDD